MTANTIVVALLDGYLVKEIPPPRWTPHDDETEVDTAARYPFNAWEYAQHRGQHHPKLWQRIKGSPYEKQYRERFNPAD